MSLKQQIIEDFKQAFKDKDQAKKQVLSMLKSEINNKEIELKKREEGLNDEEAIAVVSRAIKQRKDAADQYISGGRAELAEQEAAEIAILQKYLPEQMSEEEVEKAVDEEIAAMGDVDKSQMGVLMGKVMAKLKGKADGNVVRQIVEKKLA